MRVLSFAASSRAFTDDTVQANLPETVGHYATKDARDLRTLGELVEVASGLREDDIHGHHVCESIKINRQFV